MQRLKYAIRFIQAIYKKAKENPQLQKPWFRLALGSFVLLVLWLVPIVLVVSLIGLKPIGLVILGLLILLGLISLLVWGEINALEISNLFYGLIQKTADEEEVLELTTENKSSEAILQFFALPGLRILRSLRKLLKHNNVQFDDQGDYLVLPLMANEKLSLVESLVRVKQIYEENRVRFQPGIIGVENLAIATQWILIVLGIVIAFIVGRNIADPLTSRSLLVVLAAIICSIIALVFAIAGIHFKTFTRTCYFTVLYSWVKNVEIAAQTKDPEQAHPPVILSSVLRRVSRPSKEE